MKILNLYAGIGGNRKLWGNDHEITAVEINPEIAEIYKKYFPNDKVIVEDAHKYLVEHFKEYDFIWSSPPCPSHSRINNLNYIREEQGLKPKYPDMKLYQEIILLKHWFKGKWVVENVISYYNPLIKPYKRNNHYYWANFNIGETSKRSKRYIKEHFKDGIPHHNLDLSIMTNKSDTFKEQVLNNAVIPEEALYIFNCAFKEKQQALL